MNHADLCKIAVRWLKRPNSAGGHGCAVALSECKSGWSGEIPDAIGFRATGHPETDGSVVVEVKASRNDFLADRKKPHRLAGGMGNWRYFMAPAGLISTDELPERWGLLEVNARGHVRCVRGVAAYYNRPYQELVEQRLALRWESDRDREQFLLVRALANTGDPQKVLDMLREANNRNARLNQSVQRLENELRERRWDRIRARANQCNADAPAEAESEEEVKPLGVCRQTDENAPPASV